MNGHPERKPGIRRAAVLLAAVLTLSLIVCALGGTVPAAASPFPDPEILGGVHNINLTYTFAPHVTNYARHTKDSLLHDVGYYDKNGKLQDTFMDAYLFLPCVCAAPSGGTMYESSNPARASDWIAYVNDLFLDAYNVNALESAVAEVGKGLGNPGYKVKVFFTLLFPHDGQKNFGSLDGKTSLDFSDQDDRFAAVEWLMDEEIRLFREGNYEHLELAGFYWFEEFISRNDPNDVPLIKRFNGRVHDLGYKSIWIPYYVAEGYDLGYGAGFDVVCMQPNLMWMGKDDSKRVPACIDICKRYGMSMEMELDNDAQTVKYNRFLAYLRGGVTSGINQSINMYYHGSRNDALYYAKTSSDSQARSIYDLTYKYAKGTLTLEEIPADVPTFPVPKGYKWISTGKPYEASPAYTGDGSLVYQNVDGKELTDGIYGSSVWSTDFHAFHRTLQEPGGGYQITVDLGEIESRIGAFVIELGDEEESGIGLPTAPVVWVSENGTDFREVGKMQMSAPSNGIAHARLTVDPVRARYVRVTFSGKS